MKLCARRAEKKHFSFDAKLKEKELQDNICILLGWNSIKCKFDVLNVSQTHICTRWRWNLKRIVISRLGKTISLVKILFNLCIFLSSSVLSVGYI